MKLQDFLKKANLEEKDIINYEGQEALEKVREHWANLKFVKKQTKESC